MKGPLSVNVCHARDRATGCEPLTTASPLGQQSELKERDAEDDEDTAVFTAAHASAALPKTLIELVNGFRERSEDEAESADLANNLSGSFSLQEWQLIGSLFKEKTIEDE